MTIYFEKSCLYCGDVVDTLSYNCECIDQRWQTEYRALDLRLKHSSAGLENIARSFYNYNLDDEKGMLQYRALPNRGQGGGTLKVGNTPLLRLKAIGEKLGADIYMKSEGHNPSGCFKDRETLMCLLNSRKRGLNKAVIYSSGNAAGSAAIFAQRNDLHLVTFVSGDTYQEKIDFIRSHGSDVVVVGGRETNFETGYRLFSQLNTLGHYAKLGFDNWSVRNPYRVEGDKTTAVEIIRQMNPAGTGPNEIRVPDFVIVPTANGSCMAGMWKGFKELYDLGFIKKLPKMVSGGISNANPVFKAVKTDTLAQPSICDLSKMDRGDAEIGSIILAEEGYDSIEAARAVVASGGDAVEVGKSDIAESLYMLLKDERELCMDKHILPEPASLISIAAVKKLKDKLRIKPDDKVVSVVTGTGVKSIGMIRSLLPNDPTIKAMVEDIYGLKRKELYPPAPQQGRMISVAPEVEAIKEAFNKLKTKPLGLA